MKIIQNEKIIGAMIILFIIAIIALSFKYLGEEIRVDIYGDYSECEHLKGTCEYYSCMSLESDFINRAQLEEMKYQNCLLKNVLNKK